MRFYAILLAISPAFAQMPTAFDAASVKPAVPFVPGPGAAARLMNTGGPGTNDPGRIHYPYVTVKSLVMKAYDLADYRVYGPASIESEHYQIEATIPHDTTPEQFRAMLQNLLAERFKLTVHHEPREITNYTLVVAKGGPKMKESPAEPGPGARVGLPMKVIDGHISNVATLMTMPDFARRLSVLLNRQVTDATGLTAKYDFTIEYSTEGLANTFAVKPADEPYPTLFAALPAQIGLRLEPKKSPIDAIIIDHVEKPEQQ